MGEMYKTASISYRIFTRNIVAKGSVMMKNTPEVKVLGTRNANGYDHI
jgi:hypothetical protein